MISEPIDAVITWVDGYDPSHQQKIIDYFLRLGIDKPKSIEPTRFNQCGEIAYCLKSISYFAPWIRTIYLVTDGQTPHFVTELQSTKPFGERSTEVREITWDTQHDEILRELANKIKIIDHRDIFRGYEAYLPVFNSLTIELMLWRIEGLSEHFIYFNDDCFLLRPTKPRDFFREDKLVLRGEWKTQTEQKWYQRLRQKIVKKSPAINDHRMWQEQSAKLAGCNKRFFHLPHAPLPLKKQTFVDFFQQHPDVLLNNIRYPFRNKQQIWPISLAQHIDIKKNRAIFDNGLKSIMINGAFHSITKIKTRLTKANQDKRAAFLCVQSLDETPNSVQELIINWLNTHITI
ncbi:MAG: stealth family protein [Legionellaceae bacterium]|nr:stealth family protein [Legionellaceae bacterium]